jgi:pyruvate/2-oxoglutarate/acetoin dehydrogenase E1 component
MNKTVLDSLNTGLLDALAGDPRVLFMGEDILDPYGGAFKVSRGCSTRFPQQVLTTPISEGGLAGVAAGLALRGYRPVLEIMFGDFMTLLADQLVNHISKFRWMYNDSVELPLLIRTPMGGRRGYGPTHSQTLEKLYLGVPGLTIVAPNHFTLNENGEPGQLLQRLILESNSPVLFIENKLQYLFPLKTGLDLPDFKLRETFEVSDAAHLFPVRELTVRGAPAPVCTLTTYGYMSELCAQAMLTLAYEYEIFCRLVIPTKLSPFETSALVESVNATGNLVIVEEGTKTLGWGAEVAALTAEALGSRLKNVSRVAARQTPIPAAPTLEASTLPQVADIVNAVRKQVGLHG